MGSGGRIVTLNTQKRVNYLNTNLGIIINKCIASRNPNSCDLSTSFNNVDRLCNELVTAGKLSWRDHISQEPLNDNTLILSSEDRNISTSGS